MMVFDWLLAVVPVTFSVMVFGLALGTQPIDLSLQEMTVANALGDSGYQADAVDDLLERKIAAIVVAAGSDRKTGKIEIGTADTTINAYAQIVNLAAPVRATQRLLGMVDYIAETRFFAEDDNKISGSLNIKDSDTLRTERLFQYQSTTDKFDDMLDDMAADVVGFLDPYIYVVYLYENAARENSNESMKEVVTKTKQFIPVSSSDLIPWYYGLLGQIAVKLDDPVTATAYYEAALDLDPNFYLAHVNLGRLLFSEGNTNEAIEHYVAALKIKPTLPSANLSLAHALLAQNQYKDAFAALARAGQVAPNFAEVYLTRAEVYERLGLPMLADQQRARAEVALAREPHQNLYDTL